MTFNYPKTTGISYSLCVFSLPLWYHHTDVLWFSTDSGFYEISRYRFNSNGVWNFNFLWLLCSNSPPGSQPTCITGVVNWVHGTYTLNPNGSITAVPLGDGFQQIQDPCAAVSNFIEPYNDTEYYQQWRIFLDAQTGYKLHLFQFDGAPLAPMFLVSTSPNMLPLELLRKENQTAVAGQRTKNTLASSAENLLRPQWMLGAIIAAAVVLMAI